MPNARNWSPLACLIVGAIASPLRADFTTIINVPPTVLTQSPTTVGAGTQVNMLNGANVNVELDVGTGGEVNISGGKFSNTIFTNGALNVSGGVSDLLFLTDGQMSLSGGAVDWVRMGGGTLNMTGGSVARVLDRFQGRLDVGSLSTANISGGTFGLLYATDSVATVNISGGEYRLNGVPIAGLGNVGDSPD